MYYVSHPGRDYVEAADGVRYKASLRTKEREGKRCFCHPARRSGLMPDLSA